MPLPILATKIAVPPRRAGIVARERLDERLSEGLHRRLTLVSAPAGFGKTTLVADWASRCGSPVAWLSLDEADRDPAQFVTDLVAALRTVAPEAGEAVLPALELPQPPAVASVLANVVNDLAAAPADFVLVLDDLHAVDARAVDDALAFLIDHAPGRMHLLIATREDPALPLARLRAAAELVELRAADLRFTTDESTSFLNETMDLRLSAANVSTLEATTEGWIAGLQLAAVSLRGESDPAAFIRSFSGSHRFVLDYLVEEVLGRQPAAVTAFLLRTSILDRLCGELCDAVTFDPATPGRQTLELLERTNLFVVPLDDERRWYRYHHLFRDLLAQRLSQAEPPPAIDELQLRASRWYEDNGFEVEAFRHAAAGHDVERAARLIEGKGLPLYLRGALAPIVDWLSSLPDETLDAWPNLRVVYATVLLGSGHTAGIEEMLDRAESIVRTRVGTNAPDQETRSLLGRLASVRVFVALSRHQADRMIAESKRALEYLPEDDLPGRSAVAGTLGYAYEVLGDRAAAKKAYAEALPLSRATGSRFGEMVAVLGLAGIEERDTDLRAAAATYEEAVGLAADLPYPIIAEAHLGLARIAYEWNHLTTAWQRAQRSLEFAGQLENTDRTAASQVMLARVKLAEGDIDGAERILGDAERSIRELPFVREGPNVAAVRAELCLRGRDLEGAERAASEFDLAAVRARVFLARGEAAGALAVLEPYRSRAEARGWADERLQALVLEALASRAAGDVDRALAVLSEVLESAAREGYIRLFVDEGPAMARLLREAAPGPHRRYVLALLAAFDEPTTAEPSPGPPGGLASAGMEPLTKRELELVELIAEGLSNQEIADRLFLSPQTVKVHVRNIYSKLGANSRTQAVARARSSGILPGS